MTLARKFQKFLLALHGLDSNAASARDQLIEAVDDAGPGADSITRELDVLRARVSELDSRVSSLEPPAPIADQPPADPEASPRAPAAPANGAADGDPQA